MQSGREQVVAWLERSRMNQREFAREIALTEAHLSQILTGKRRPGLPIAVRIEDRTGIPVRSWLPQPVGSSAGKRGNRARLQPKTRPETGRISEMQSHGA